MNKNQVKLHENQKKSLIDEATKAGLTPTEVNEIPLGDPNSSAGSVLKSMTGGKYRPDYLQLLKLNDGQFYVQPYSGLACLPGEHYIQLKGGLNSGLFFQPPIIGKANWYIPKDKKATKEFRKANPELVKASKTTKLEWPIGMGSIDLDWGYQLIGTEQNDSLLAMKAGRYGGFTTYLVGFLQFKRVYSSLKGILKPDERTPAETIHPLQYFELVQNQLMQ